MTQKRTTVKQQIDCEIPGLGRLLDSGSDRFCKRSGATTAAGHTKRKAILQRLRELGQLAVIAQLVTDDVSWEELIQAEREGRLGSDSLAIDVALRRPLWDVDGVPGAFSATLPDMGNTRLTRTRYELAFEHLRLAPELGAKATVLDLGRVNWKALFVLLADRAPSTRDVVRTAVSSFLTKFTGDLYHPFRRQVMTALGPKEDDEVQSKEVTVEEFLTNVAALAEAVQPVAWVLAATSMRIHEFLQCDEESIRRLPAIWLHKTKGGKGKEKYIAPHLAHWAKAAIPCRLAPMPKLIDGQYPGANMDPRYNRIAKAFKAAAKVTGIPWSPHYLRHLFAQVGVDHLPESLVQQATGHKTQKVFRRYTTRRDASAVAAMVGEKLSPAVAPAPAPAPAPEPTPAAPARWLTLLKQAG